MQITSIKHDVNGNPRKVVHFTNFILQSDPSCPADRYGIALQRTRKIGGRKYHNKSYGGGIVFQCYSESELENDIKELLRKEAANV